MKICYVTSQTPYGKGEQFILPEINKLNERNNQVTIIPVRPDAELATGEEARSLAGSTIRESLISFKIFAISLKVFFLNPIKGLKILKDIFTDSRGVGKIIKNICVMPKGLYISQLIREKGIEHIHCHWASTSSTMGYIASLLSGVPFSITAHRWDIAENNMLRVKAKHCKFIRVIDDPGYEEMIEFIGDEHKYKCTKIHVGVDIKSNNVENVITKEKSNSFIMAMAANFVEKKGHIYLIEALKDLKKKAYDFKLYLYGSGELEDELKSLVKKYDLEKEVIFAGKIAHDALLEKYYNREIDCFVLPSIVTESGEKEGIPVSLMEAMAAKIPVVSTYTGGIYELIDGKTGLIVEEKNSKVLEEAIESLINDIDLRKNLAEEGAKKVSEEFHISTVAKMLEELFLS
ncbi:glycosyltransferase [Hathewaya histolytica]|uniref:glycosyltransferase n=1 Tax=Hathewaya histolytica TaxID=1498 RepID=UPI003B66E106